MVEEEIKNVPELRFSEFKGALEKKLLGDDDIATFSKGKGISKADIFENGKTPCIRYGELYTYYGDVIDEVISSTNIDPTDLLLSHGNEVLVPASGETPIDIARSAVVKKSGIALGGDLNVITFNGDGHFLAAYLGSKKRVELARLSQGNSVVHLYAAQLKSLFIYLPSITEQQKIAAFLSSVDDKIIKLRRKCKLLKTHKRGLMQKIFSQELRFSKDDGSAFPDWMEMKLSDLADRQTAKNIDDSINRVLTNSAIKGVLDQRDYFYKDIANADNLDGYYIIEKGDYVYNPRISVHAPVGPINKNRIGQGVMSPLYSIFRFKDKSNHFYEQYFKTKQWHRYMCSVANYGARHDRMNITTSDFMDLPLPCPHTDEQKKIVSCLDEFDKKIDAVTSQLTENEAFKKGLLKKMFV